MRDYTKKNKKKAPRAFKKKVKKPRDLKGFFRKGLMVAVSCAITGVTAGVLYGAWFYVMTTPYFRISRINIEGNGEATKESILQAAAIDGGANIFSVNLGDVGRRIEAIPWVKKVSLARVFPDELHIKIVERRPVALINLGRFYYFDEEGNIFALANNTIGWDYPVFSGIDKGNLLDGDETTIALIDEGIGLLSLLKKSEREISLENIAELRLDANRGITLYMARGGPPVHLGRGNYELKLDHSERVFADLRRKGIGAAGLEVDFDDRVIVKMRI